MAEPNEVSPPIEDRNDEEMDQDIDADMADTQDNSTKHGQDTSSSTLDHEPTTQTSTQPTTSSPHHNRKDTTLREFITKMDDYAPIIPDAVTAHYLTVSGLPPPDPTDPSGVKNNTTPLPLARLLALATQKFIADIAADAYQYSRIRSSNSASANNPLGGAPVPGQPAAGAGGKNTAQAGQLGVQRSGYGGGGQGGSGQGRTVLTMEDLGMAVGEYGVNVKRSEFYR